MVGLRHPDERPLVLATSLLFSRVVPEDGVVSKRWKYMRHDAPDCHGRASGVERRASACGMSIRPGGSGRSTSRRLVRACVCRRWRGSAAARVATVCTVGSENLVVDKKLRRHSKHSAFARRPMGTAGLVDTVPVSQTVLLLLITQGDRGKLSPPPASCKKARNPPTIGPAERRRSVLVSA